MNVELDDVYGVIATSFWHTFVGKSVLLLGSSGLLLLCYLLFKWLKRYRAQSTKDRALTALRLLRQKIDTGDQDPKKVYRDLTEIIKQYAQWRFGLARGLSDYELMAALATQPYSIQNEESLRKIISQAQIIKFGLALAQKNQMKEDIDVIISFISTTEQSLLKAEGA